MDTMAETGDSWARLCIRCRNLKVHGTPSQVSRSLIAVTAEGVRGARTGCLLCKLLSKHVSQGKSYSPSAMWPQYTQHPEDPASKEADPSGPASVQAYTCVDGDLVLFVEEGDPASEFVVRRPPMLTYDCEAAYNKIRGWMSACGTESHPKCRPISDLSFPTRLVNVGSAERDPFLVSFADRKRQRGRYAALSYCWGHSQSVVLTRVKFESGDWTFPLSTLPATLCDAIEVCRRLDIPYLWVDALCIIQDWEDSADWKKESAVMDEIYGNAAITIAASAAKDTSEGIFRFPAALAADERFTVPYSLMNGQVGRAFVQFFPLNEDKKQPLATRAWAFQEALMSPRVVSFQRNQLVWECDSHRLFANDVQSKSTAPTHRLLKSWEQHIGEYTRCQSTFASDRLAAISGYAKSRQGVTKTATETAAVVDDVYFAGLWKSRIWYHLLWSVNSDYPSKCRPPNYIAPTFSWASVDQPVTFTFGNYNSIFDDFKMDITDIFTSVSPLNRFGSIQPSPPSYIRLRGRLIAGLGLQLPTVHNPGYDPLIPKYGGEVIFDIVSEEEYEYADSYEDPDGPWMEGNFKLWLFRASERIVFILKPHLQWDMESPYVFQRVGLLNSYSKIRSLFRKTVDTEVTIV